MIPNQMSLVIQQSAIEVVAVWSTGFRYGDSEFFSRVPQVAEEECKHHRMLETRLHELGSSYGAFPVHDALWYAQSSPIMAAQLVLFCFVRRAIFNRQWVSAEHLLTVGVNMWTLTFSMCPDSDMMYQAP
jgi:hypothetical protein